MWADWQPAVSMGASPITILIFAKKIFIVFVLIDLLFQQDHLALTGQSALARVSTDLIEVQSRG